jgi:hypothetical protein
MVGTAPEWATVKKDIKAIRWMEHIFTFILNFKSSKNENNIDFCICHSGCCIMH